MNDAVGVVTPSAAGQKVSFVTGPDQSDDILLAMARAYVRADGAHSVKVSMQRCKSLLIAMAEFKASSLAGIFVQFQALADIRLYRFGDWSERNRDYTAWRLEMSIFEAMSKLLPDGLVFSDLRNYCDPWEEDCAVDAGCDRDDSP